MGRNGAGGSRPGCAGGGQPLDFGRLAGRGRRFGSGRRPRLALGRRQDAEDHEIPITTHRQRLTRLFRLPSLPRIPFMPAIGLPTACTAMGALILG
jgi:hypothetical protein